MEGLLMGVGLGVLLRQVVLPFYVRAHRRHVASALVSRRHRGR